MERISEEPPRPIARATPNRASLSRTVVPPGLMGPSSTTPASKERLSMPVDLTLEPGKSELEALTERHLRLPAEDLLCLGRVGTTNRRVVNRSRDVLDARMIADDVLDQLGQLTNGDLLRIADIDRTGLLGEHEPKDPLDEVVHVAERPRLAPVTVHGKRPVLEGRLEEA